MKFLNLFKKSNQEENQEQGNNLVAAITYTIDNTGEMFVDINLNDDEERAMSELAVLLSTISSVKGSLVVLEMIKRSFEENDMIEKYMDFVSEFLSRSEMVMEDQTEFNDQPYIKPSEML